MRAVPRPDPRLDFNAIVLQQLLEFADVVLHRSLLALELLQVAPALGAPGDPIRHIAFEVLVGAVGASLGKRIASDLSDLQ